MTLNGQHPDHLPNHLPGERWADIPGHERGYQVSDIGRVRSLPRILIRSNGIPLRLSGKLLRPKRIGPRYLGVTLSSRENAFIHRLVLAAFVGPLPPGLVVRHLNGNHLDNRLDNLAYGTMSENAFDSVRHGTHPQARMTECKQKHSLSGDNLRITTGGKRVCRTCARENMRRYRKAAAR